MTREDIIHVCDIAWQEKLLELIGYNIGDEVLCLFHPQFGTAKECNGTCVVGRGTIVRMEDGQIKIKSNEKYQQGKCVRRYPSSPNNFQTYWKYELDYEYADLKLMLNVKQKEE